MPVVKLKVDDVDRPVEDILSLFHTMTGFDLMYYRMENDILAVFMTSDQHVDHVMTGQVRAALANEGVEVVKSEEYLANSTVIAKNVPRSLHDKSLQDIADDISFCNDVQVLGVDWKGEDTLFIEFNTIEDATKVLNAPEGIKLSYERSITDVKKKPYLHIPQCPRCFSFEHESNGCPKTVRTCFHCGEEGHAGEECSTSYVRCANCGGNHVAFAFKCPVRMQKESEMKEDGWCPPDSVDGVRSREGEHEVDSTTRAEEEVSIIFGRDRLRLEEPEQCSDFEETADSPNRSAPSSQTCADPTGLRGSPEKLSEAPGVSSEDTIDGGEPRGSVEPSYSTGSATAGAHARASIGMTSRQGRRVEDPLPVAPVMNPYPRDRPPSRLGDPALPPVLRPVPRAPRSPSSVPSPPREAKDHRERLP